MTRAERDRIRAELAAGALTFPAVDVRGLLGELARLERECELLAISAREAGEGWGVAIQGWEVALEQLRRGDAAG